MLYYKILLKAPLSCAIVENVKDQDQNTDIYTFVFIL